MAARAYWKGQNRLALVPPENDDDAKAKPKRAPARKPAAAKAPARRKRA